MQQFIAQVGRDKKVHEENASVMAFTLMAMVCLAEQPAATQVENFVRALSPESLKACIQVLWPYNLGAMLADPSPSLAGVKALVSLKCATVEIVRDRIGILIAARKNKPGHGYVALHLAIAKLAGATGEEEWYRQAIPFAKSSIGAKYAHKPSLQLHSRAGKAHATFRTQVEDQFPPISMVATE